MKISEIREKFPMYKDVPDEQLVIGLHRKFYSDMPFQDFHKQIQYDKAPDATEGMGGIEKFRAGAGKAFSDIALGVKQLVGADVQDEVDERKRRDSSLMNTGAGLAGNITGNAAMFAPTVAIPGANTLTGAALLGAASGAIQPVASNESRTENALLGAGSGLGGHVAGKLIGKAITPVTSRLGPKEAALAAAAKREGIPLTAGQATGSRPLQITESVMENLPLTSGSQLAGREAQQRAFTAAALRRAGMTGDVADAASLQAQKKTLGGQFQTIAGRNAIDFNQGTILNDLSKVASEGSRRLSHPEALTNTIDDIVSDAANGVMDGSKYQGWRETLRRLSSGNDTSAHYFGEVKKALDKAFNSQISQADSVAWKQASKEYGNLKTIIDAMGGPGNLPATSQIAPNQLAAALSRSVGREGKALGRGDLNELTRIGQVFVRDNIPNSGTAQRQLAQSLLTAGGGSGLGALGAGATGNDPMAGAMLGAGLTAGGLVFPKIIQALMNSKAGQAYLTNTALSAGQRKALVDALRLGAVGAAPALSGP